MRRLIFIILVIAFSSIYYLSTQEDSNSPVQKVVQTVKAVVKNVSLTAAGLPESSENQQNASKESDSSEVDPNIENLATLSDRQLRTWILQDSKNMDSVNHDTKQVAVRLRAQARTLAPEQLSVLSEVAFDFKMPANSRVLAGYILTLSELPQAVESMKDLASKALPDFGPVLPHSEAELRRTQELALRYMQVDEMAERAKTDVNARDKLSLLSASAESEEVRAYALRKLKSLK